MPSRRFDKLSNIAIKFAFLSPPNKKKLANFGLHYITPLFCCMGIAAASISGFGFMDEINRVHTNIRPAEASGGRYRCSPSEASHNDFIHTGEIYLLQSLEVSYIFEVR